MVLTSETWNVLDLDLDLTAVLCGEALGAEVRELALPTKSLAWLVCISTLMCLILDFSSLASGGIITENVPVVYNWSQDLGLTFSCSLLWGLQCPFFLFALGLTSWYCQSSWSLCSLSSIDFDPPTTVTHIFLNLWPPKVYFTNLFFFGSNYFANFSLEKSV